MKKKLSVIISVILVLSMLICATPAVTAAENEAPFRINCTVNGDTKTQRGFTWFTYSNNDSLLIIDGVDASNIIYDDVIEFEGAYCHKALAKGLEAGKTYTYTVGSKSVRSEEGTFTTDDGDDVLNFIAVADVQASSAENFEAGAETVRAALEMCPNSDFVINCGDYTNDSTNEEWNLYDASFSDINAVTTSVPVAGNHDGLGVWNWFNSMFNLDTAESVQVLNGVNYSFDYGNCHIAVVNTNDLLSISIAQLEWLKNDMNSTDKDWKIVAMHKSPYTHGKDGKWPDALYLQDSLTSVLDECDVDLVLSGHDHQYLRTKKITNNKPDENGVTYVLIGTAGTKRYQVREFLGEQFLDNDLIGAMVIQKDGYGNYWNGTDWNSTDEKNIGGCFNIVSIEGGNLTFKSYILSDTLVDEDGNRLVTNVDTFTLTKKTGQNKITFTGDNTTSQAKYYLGVIPSFNLLAAYTFIKWLPKFLWIVPKMISALANGESF